ncbi:MAG: DTW domain-containing protein [Comamonadaceae bacterium]|nr:MAG: DTW domain-containing protein [Comamonadaceae bacterium]
MNAIRPDPVPVTVTRETCARCLRPQSACICQWVRPTAHDVEVVILQHPLEVNEAKGSGYLLHLGLPKSRLLAGEVFDADTLFAADPSGAQPRRNLLLYPETPLAACEAPRDILTPEDLQNLAGLRLIVLDATWRKSRKMLRLNPWLEKLPRLALAPENLPGSRYLIRKAHKSGQLSTYEATCAALMQLRGDATLKDIEARFQPLMEAFDGFVAQQDALRLDAIARRGR